MDQTLSAWSINCLTLTESSVLGALLMTPWVARHRATPTQGPGPRFADGTLNVLNCRVPAHWLMVAEVAGRVLMVPLATSTRGDPSRCRPIGCYLATDHLARRFREDR